MVTRLARFIVAIVVGVAAAGCQTVNTVERAESRAAARVIQDKRVTTDSSLKAKALVVDLRETTVGNGLLKVQAQLRNTTHHRKRFNYRFDWIDDAGMVIDTPMSSWKPFSLAGKESGFVAAVAPTPRAVDFRLKLIEPTD